MRTISDEQARLIVDAVGELSLSLSPAILEKDVLVTEALRAISKIDRNHSVIRVVPVLS